jgi:hypothetical protein
MLGKPILLEFIEFLPGDSLKFKNNFLDIYL